MKSFHKGLAAFAASVSLIAIAGPAAAQTLEETLALAYQSNPSLQAERARLRSAQESAVQARAGRLPTVNAQAQISRQHTEAVRVFDPTLPPIESESDATPKSYSLSASQSLYRGGRTSGAIDQADASVLAASEALRSSEQGVFVEAVTAFVDVRRDFEVVDIRRNNVEVLAEQLRAAEDRFEVGEITRTDVAQARARLSGAQAQLSAAQAQLAASRAAYERVVGQAPATLPDPPDLPDMPEHLADAAEVAYNRNPDLLAALYSEEASGHAVRVARGALLPEVTVTASATGSRDGSFTGDEVDSTAIVGRVTLPIFTGGLNRSRVRSALAEEDQARFQVRDARRRVTEGLTNAWNGYIASLAVIQSSEQAVEANEIALDGVQQEAFVGIRTTLDVLNAEQELLESRLALVSAERDSYIAAYRLLQAMGVLGPVELGLAIDPIDPLARSGDGFSLTNVDLTPWN